MSKDCMGDTDSGKDDVFPVWSEWNKSRSQNISFDVEKVIIC